MIIRIFPVILGEGEGIENAGMGGGLLDQALGIIVAMNHLVEDGHVRGLELAQLLLSLINHQHCPPQP
jgi:hypothetical protein